MGYIGNQITTVFPSSISVDSATISGNTTIGGTLGVTGATTLSNKLADTNMSVGSIVQIQQGKKTTIFTTSSSTYVEVPGFSVAITPSSSSNKILVHGSVHHASVNSSGGGLLLYRAIGSGSFASVGQINTDTTNGSRRKSNWAGSSYTGDGASDEIMIMTAVCDILDSPNTTEAVTYKVFVVTNGSGYFFNRPETTSNTSDQVEGVSTLTAMEVVG